jgi:hypothetical protein
LSGLVSIKWNEEEELMSRKVLAIVSLLLVTSGLCFGQITKAQTPSARTDYQAQLQQLSTTVQSHVQSLETQLTAATPAQRDELQRQIVQTKRQGEISRLEILLQWARERGDTAKITEIEDALENWRNPPQTQSLPQIEKKGQPAQSTPQPSSK